jgi:hypothetical protein
MKRFILMTAMVAALPFVAACAKSVPEAARDVDRAQQKAAQNVQEEQRQLEDVKRDSAERIARQERRVEDAARQGNEQVTEERRDLEDAQRIESRRETNDVTPVTPRVDDRSAVERANERPARVDVNINRGPASGVDVNVNRTP